MDGDKIWINTTTLPARNIYTDAVINGKKPGGEDLTFQLNLVEYAMTFPSAEDAVQLITDISKIFLQYPLSDNRKEYLLNTLLDEALDNVRDHIRTTIAEANLEEDDLSDLAVGLLKLGGVEFDVRGVIQLRRSEAWGGPWQLAPADDPVRVDGIPIEREAVRLILLLGTIRPELDGTIIGRLVLHYADGETRSLELVYGRDVREWWYDPADADAETTDRAKVVWTGSNPVANEYGRRLRLYLNMRENPRPGVKITTFDFVSALSNSAPFVIAVTVE